MIAARKQQDTGSMFAVLFQKFLDMTPIRKEDATKQAFQTQDP
jgi:hypothetical protein